MVLQGNVARRIYTKLLVDRELARRNALFPILRADIKIRDPLTV